MKRRSLFFSFIDVSAVLLLACGAAVLLARWHWLAELAVHFAAQYIVAGAILFPLLLGARRYILAVPVAAMTIWQMTLVYPLFAAVPTADYVGRSVTLAQFNVMYTNKEMDRLADWLKRGGNVYDIISLQELTPALASRLWEVERIYPYQLVVPSDDAYGYAVLSKYPFTSMSRRYSPDGLYPYGELEVEVAKGKVVHLFAVHTAAPVSAARARSRNEELAALAQAVRESESPYKIIIGDLNITPFSPYFRDLLATAELTSVAAGKGWHPTFAAQHHFRLLQIPIDHVLVSEGVHVVGYDVWQDSNGSDHKPVAVSVRFD